MAARQSLKAAQKEVRLNATRAKWVQCVFEFVSEFMFRQIDKTYAQPSS